MTWRGAVTAVGVLAMVGGGVTSPAVSAATPTAARQATADSCDPLTLRQRVAQTVMTGIPGTRTSSTSVRMVERHAGSVILLGYNVSNGRQLRRLTRGLRRHAPARLLVAVDEEGGRVARLGEKGIVDHLPSARTMARTRTRKQIRRLGARLGRQMAAVGMDWNLAPVLDVANPRRRTAIGDRSYSGDPAVVAKAGRAFAAGLRSEGIMTTGKHFPGIGRTTVDSHHRMPTVTASLRKLHRRDIRPFAEALPVLDAVMSGHVRYTALDRKRPASLSRAATRLLRRDLDYQGLLITDALGMGAITRRWTVPEAAEKALRAGADVLLVVDWRTTPSVTSRIVAAVRDGRISRDRVDQAASRVLRAKGYGPARVSCLLSR